MHIPIWLFVVWSLILVIGSPFAWSAFGRWFDPNGEL